MSLEEIRKKIEDALVKLIEDEYLHPICGVVACENCADAMCSCPHHEVEDEER